jgi:hypothetical protein
MNTTLTHLQKHYWTDSKIFDNMYDEDGNAKTMKTYLKEARKFALGVAALEAGCKKSEAQITNEYKFIYGAMGEVLSEFWLKLFCGRYDIAGIADTSANKFQRGYDFTGMSVFDMLMNVLIQVKMQGKPTPFELGKLHTFFDEAERAGSLPQYTILMVPTSDLSNDDILSYKKNFKQDYLSKMRFIGHNEMDNAIIQLPSNRFKNANLEFFTRFKESLEINTCPIPDYVI